MFKTFFISLSFFFFLSPLLADCNFKTGKYIEELSDPSFLKKIDIKIPKSFGRHSKEKSGANLFQGGNLNFIDGSHRFMSNSVFKIVPKVGDFYLFPHYLMHTVYPFKETDEERRSISFNAYIDQDIYNVYGR